MIIVLFQVLTGNKITKNIALNTYQPALQKA